MFSRLCSIQKPFLSSLVARQNSRWFSAKGKDIVGQSVGKDVVGQSVGKDVVGQSVGKDVVEKGGVGMTNSFSQQSGSNQTVGVFDLGKAKFVNRVLKTTCGGIGLSFATSAVSVVAFQGNLIAPLVIGLCGSFASIFMISATKNRQFVQDKEGHLYSLDPPIRKYGFFGLCTSMGMMISPSILIFGLADPVVLPIAAGLSFGIMGTVSYMAMRSKTLNMLQFGPPLFGGLCGLIGLGVVGIGAHMMGFHHVAEVLHQVDLYAGVGIFTALIGYDIHLAISKYDSGEPDHLEVSTNLFLDFINLFIRLMEIISKLRKD